MSTTIEEEKDHRIIKCTKHQSLTPHLNHDDQAHVQELELALFRDPSRNLKHEDVKKMFLTFESTLTFDYDSLKSEHQKLLCKEALPGWLNADIAKIEVENISGLGGSRTYLISCQGSEPEKVCLHGLRICEKDPFTEERMHDAQKAMWEYGVAIPRIISGKGWYIEPFVNDRSKIHHEKKCINKDMARFLACIHKVPIDWWKPWREKLLGNYPLLKDCNEGNHIWLFTTRLEWYEEYKQYHKMWHEAGFQPLSEHARKIVTNHGDFHSGNKLYCTDGTALAIDYEFTHPSWACNDIAYIFDLSQFGTDSKEGRWKFVKHYQREMLSREAKDEEIELFVFDSICNQTRVFHPAQLLKEIHETLENNSYDFRIYKVYEEFEKKAREDNDLIKQIVQKGFREVANENCEEFRKVIQVEVVKNLNKNNQNQLFMRRNNLKITYEEDIIIHKKAFEDHNIIKIRTDVAIDWREAKQQAADKAHGLPTREQLKKSGLNAGDDFDFWMYVQREDGKADVCQMGNHPSDNKERYISHVDTFGDPSWINDNQEIHLWRPTKWFYAIRDPEKNQKFAPIFSKIDEEVSIKARRIVIIDDSFNTFKRQFIKRRELYDYAKDVEMLQKAFDKRGIIRVDAPHTLTYIEAIELAEKEGCGKQPTIKEFEESGIAEPDGVHHWAYARTEDDKDEVVQLGNKPGPCKRYLSHIEQFGSAPNWRENNDCENWRNSKWIYIKKCDHKTPEFIKPNDDAYYRNMFYNHFVKVQKEEMYKKRSKEEQEEVDFLGEKKGVFKLEVDKYLNWEDTKNFVESKGYDLPTKEQLKESEVNVKLEECYNFVKREDGVQDLVGLGLNKIYLSLYDAYKLDANANEPFGIPNKDRALTFVYVFKK